MRVISECAALAARYEKAAYFRMIKLCYSDSQENVLSNGKSFRLARGGSSWEDRVQIRLILIVICE